MLDARRIWVAVALCLAAVHARATAPAPLDETMARMVRPAPGEWPTYGRDYGQQRFSPLTQIESLSPSDPRRKAHVSGSTGVGINMAPVVYSRKVILGITGVGYGMHVDAPRPGAPLGAVLGVEGRYGRPGFLAAYDVDTGRPVWRFDTVPSRGWEGRFASTTADGVPLPRDVAKERAAAAGQSEAWRYGGGSAWTTPTIDVERGLLFFGTGNPSPQLEDSSRPGDNLYTVSLVALDAETGKLRWYYQQVPHDLWGYDVASPPWLLELVRDGKKVPAVGQASKLGWLYVHDRITGELLVKSESVVPQKNVFALPTVEGTGSTPRPPAA